MHSSEHLRILVVAVVIGGAALIVSLRARPRPSKRGSMSPGCWWGIPYTVGALLCVIGLVAPEPGWREPLSVGGPPVATMVALAGAALILSGAIIHLVLWRLGRLSGSRDERLWPMLALAGALCAVAFQLLAHRGVNVGFWVMLACGGGVVVVLALCVLLSYLQARSALSMRIARLVVDGRVAEAIEIGEAIPPEERDPRVQLNLAAAYCESGDLERAEALFAEARARPDLHEHFRKMTDDWLERIAREKTSRETRGDADGTVETPPGAD